MDFFKTQLDHIQQQLGGLSASQKMLTACLVFIIVMTVMMWGKYAAEPDMQSVFTEALTPDELVAAKRHLTNQGIRNESSPDGRLLVPSDKLPEAIAGLTFSQLIPRSAKIDVNALVKEINPFSSNTLNEAQLNNIKQMRLAEVISNYPGVQSAQVFVDPTEKIRIGGGGAQPSATVSIQMRRGDHANQNLVDSAAGLLVGAQSSLTWQRVSVIVDGVPRRAREPEGDGGMTGAESLQLVEAAENRIQKKLVDGLGIPNLLVTVNFNVSQESRHTRSQTYDKDGVIQKATEENERTSESTTPVAGGAGEPGALPNTGMSIAPGAAGGQQATTTETESKAKFEVLAGSTVTEVKTPAGTYTPVGAAIRIPRSHIRDVWKQEWINPNPEGNPNAQPPEPNAQAIQARFQQELKDYTTQVRIAAGLDSEKPVLVSMYTDILPRQPGGGRGPLDDGGGFAAVTAMAGAHSREIILGGLAVASLFMVSMMVRRGGGPVPAGVAMASVAAMPMPVLDGTGGLVGEVSEGQQMLDAVELDEDAVRAQQMLDQVSNMVEENPDAAAGLVRRWLNRA